MSASDESATIVAYSPAEHAAGLRECFVELQEFERTLEPSMPAGDAIADAYLRLMLERCATWDGMVFVALVGGRVGGFVCVWTRVPPEPDEPAKPYAFISDIVVSKRLRGQGIGRALLAEAERHARQRGAAVLRLDVMAGNSGARHLYEHAGFTARRVEMAKALVGS